MSGRAQRGAGANGVAKPRIVVLGGGFGGLESALNIKKRLSQQADVTLLSDKDYFLFKPNTIYIPFGLDPNKLKLPLVPSAKRKNINFTKAHVREIDPISRLVYADGTTLPYDYLVVATGATMRPEEIEGLEAHANTIWTAEDMLRLRAALHKLLAEINEGQRQRVVFLVPPNNMCPGPLYEMGVMLDTWLRRKRARSSVSIMWATYEDSYVSAFGPQLHDVVQGEFDSRGIKGHTSYMVARVEDREVIFTNGDRMEFDLLVAFPPYIAATAFPELPIDDRSFIRADMESRRVEGYPNVFAVGDSASFPVKQAFLAFLQADAAADHLSSEILGVQPQLNFDPASMYVMGEFDKSSLTQLPLRLVGKATEEETTGEENGVYKIGSSPMWRLSKMMLGIYLPWRFKSGNPFHAGLPWKGVEASLKAMSGILAR